MRIGCESQVQRLIQELLEEEVTGVSGKGEVGAQIRLGPQIPAIGTDTAEPGGLR